MKKNEGWGKRVQVLPYDTIHGT